MKHISSVLSVLILFPSLLFAQSKKDIQTQVDTLSAQIKKLEDANRLMSNELKTLQLSLTNITTTMSFVSKSNLDLEQQVKSQLQTISKLTQQNDSLLKVFGINNSPKFIVNPRNESDSIMFVVQSYFGAKKWEDRLPYVLNADGVKPLMAEAYKNEFSSILFENNKINIPGSNYTLGKKLKIFVDGEVVYLKRSIDGFKIDWEATTGYNPKSIAVFKSEKSATPVQLRVEMKLDSYEMKDYNITKTNYLSIYTDYLGDAFMPLSNANEFKKVLADGKSHQVIVEAKYQTFESEYSAYDVIIITKFIKEGWDK
jgi:hypothetical protein